MTKRFLGLVAGVIAAGLLAACSTGQSDTTQGEPELPVSLPQVDMATFTLPLDAYAMTEEQGRTAYTARNILVVRCLKEFGFTIVPPGPSEPSPGGPNERRYILASEKRAHLYGYKWPEITNQKRPPEPVLSPGARAALTGEGSSQVAGKQIPEGGCMGEANRQLAGGQDPAGPDLASRLSNEAYASMQKDSRVVAATERWSECMKRSGYHYPDPARANNDPAFSAPVATKTEIATAVADVACKKETNLINVMAAVESAYQLRAIDQHQQQLDDRRKRLSQQVELAADVIAGRK